MVEMAECMHKLPREVVGCPSSEILKAQVDADLSNLL